MSGGSCTWSLDTQHLVTPGTQRLFQGIWHPSTSRWRGEEIWSIRPSISCWMILNNTVRHELNWHGQRKEPYSVGSDQKRTVKPPERELFVDLIFEELDPVLSGLHLKRLQSSAYVASIRLHQPSWWKQVTMDGWIKEKPVFQLALWLLAVWFYTDL